ncbi:MAG: tRNA 2-thiocytidine(32) synthetase TtcA [Ruminococcaceae bacterium]|nr:tRNA 2-thiocytidine(32) synthetase TtcA [Oscillospiraceae bacterium]
MKELLSRCRAAVDRYGMIPDGASVAVGVSGGKDSLCVLLALDELRRFYPNRFVLTALTADPCFGGKETDYSAITEWCGQRGIPHIIRRTRLWEIVFTERRESNPCSLCARMRRGILHNMAKEAGCGIVALGHHADDAAETVMMNLLCGGRFAGLPAKSWLDRKELHVIRPLIFCSEALCERTARRMTLPVVKSGCPVDGDTERSRVRGLIEQLEDSYPDLRAKLAHAAQAAEDRQPPTVNPNQ